MKLSEFIPEEFDEDRKEKLARAMAGIQRQVDIEKSWQAKRERDNAPEAVAARKAAQDAHNAKRQRLEAAVSEIAKKYSGDQFEAFQSEVLSVIPQSTLQGVLDLRWAFDAFNPDRQKMSADSWADYGKKRAEHDPSVTGIGPSGARNWTGD